jgi:hypothetical protein
MCTAKYRPVVSEVAQIYPPDVYYFRPERDRVTNQSVAMGKLFELWQFEIPNDTHIWSVRLLDNILLIRQYKMMAFVYVVVVKSGAISKIKSQVAHIDSLFWSILNTISHLTIKNTSICSSLISIYK